MNKIKNIAGSKELKENENLNKILVYLDKYRSTSPDMEEICQKCQIDYNRNYNLRLENDGWIENTAKSRGGDGFKITSIGEFFINVENGYYTKLEPKISKWGLETSYSWAKEHSWLIGILLTIIGLVITIL